MDETTTAPRCRWECDAGELREDLVGSRVICDQPEDASNHKHSMLCPREHEPELICHGFAAAGRSDLEATFDIVYDANMRAIKRWQAAHPDHSELTWPDHSELVEWLLEQVGEYALAVRAMAPKAMREQHDGYHVDEGRWIKPSGGDVWCVAPCHAGGRCDGECDPECRRCPQECRMPECVAAGAGVSVEIRRHLELRQAGAERLPARPVDPDGRQALERILALQPEAAAIMRRHGFVIDLWPPAGVDRPADHLSELDEPTRWQGLAFSLYTSLVEASSLAEQLLDEGRDRG